MLNAVKQPVTANNLASHSGCIKMKLKSGAEQIKMPRSFLDFKSFDCLVVLLTASVFMRLISFIQLNNDAQLKLLFLRQRLDVFLDAVACLDELLIARRKARAAKSLAVFAEG